MLRVGGSCWVRNDDDVVGVVAGGSVEGAPALEQDEAAGTVGAEQVSGQSRFGRLSAFDDDVLVLTAGAVGEPDDISGLQRVQDGERADPVALRIDRPGDDDGTRRCADW